MTINKSGLRPLGHALLCEPYEPEFERSILAIPDHVRARQLMNEERGTLLEVGCDAWEGKKPWAKPGDKVLISKHCGAIVHGTADGKLYRLCRDEDIYCAIEVGGLESVLVEDPVKLREKVG